MTSAQGGPTSQHSFQAPTGTRDFYPAELARLRYVQDAWRKTSINHGFEEIDGPTFEHLELYTVKSGEGIVSELFSFERFGGEKKFALRPEFTPTLARLYAAKANALPKPTKWFWMQNCFRAERPQRGRLREFCQWNCDIIGLPPYDATDSEAAIRIKANADAEVLATCIDNLSALGLTPEDVVLRVSSRELVEGILFAIGVYEANHATAFSLLDARAKLDRADFDAKARAIGLDVPAFDDLAIEVSRIGFESDVINSPVFNRLNTRMHGRLDPTSSLLPVIYLMRDGYEGWASIDLSVVRGLAYYTGMVFEVHEASGAERAIAGGGRYDKLIEMFGGPPTPAVGFGMGDVVLSLVLQDKGLFPTDDAIADKLGLRPDVFVISSGHPEADAQVAPTLARLRREGLHARRSYKSSKNVGKLIGDAVKARARIALIIESATTAQLKNLTTQAQEPIELSQVVERVRRGS